MRIKFPKPQNLDTATTSRAPNVGQLDYDVLEAAVDSAKSIADLKNVLKTLIKEMRKCSG